MSSIQKQNGVVSIVCWNEFTQIQIIQTLSAQSFIKVCKLSQVKQHLHTCSMFMLRFVACVPGSSRLNQASLHSHSCMKVFRRPRASERGGRVTVVTVAKQQDSPRPRLLVSQFGEAAAHRQCHYSTKASILTLPFSLIKATTVVTGLWSILTLQHP